MPCSEAVGARSRSTRTQRAAATRARAAPAGGRRRVARGRRARKRRRRAPTATPNRRAAVAARLLARGNFADKQTTASATNATKASRARVLALVLSHATGGGAGARGARARARGARARAAREARADAPSARARSSTRPRRARAPATSPASARRVERADGERRRERASEAAIHRARVRTSRRASQLRRHRGGRRRNEQDLARRVPARLPDCGRGRVRPRARRPRVDRSVDKPPFETESSGRRAVPAARRSGAVLARALTAADSYYQASCAHIKCHPASRGGGVRERTSARKTGRHALSCLILVLILGPSRRASLEQDPPRMSYTACTSTRPRSSRRQRQG